MKRLSDLMLIVFPLIALAVIFVLFKTATDGLDDAWQDQQGQTVSFTTR